RKPMVSLFDTPTTTSMKSVLTSASRLTPTKLKGFFSLCLKLMLMPFFGPDVASSWRKRSRVASREADLSCGVCAAAAPAQTSRASAAMNSLHFITGNILRRADVEKREGKNACKAFPTPASTERQSEVRSRQENRSA